MEVEEVWPRRAVLEARQRAGLTQHRVAELAGVSQSVVSRVERGVGAHRIATYEKLAAVLGLEFRVGDRASTEAVPSMSRDPESTGSPRRPGWRSGDRRGNVRTSEAYEYPPPGLLLVFQPPSWNDEGLPGAPRAGEPTNEPVRPLDVAYLLNLLDELYLVSMATDAPPSDYERNPEWAAAYNLGSLQARLGAIRMESPLHVLLELPWPVYTASFSAFAYGLAHLLGVPYKAVARFHKARAEYFDSRLEAAEAKERWLDWKKSEAQRRNPFMLREVHEASMLPPPGKSMELPPAGDPDYPANG